MPVTTRRVVELIQSAIGEVRQAHTWVSRAWVEEPRRRHPQGRAPVPEFLDWDLWIRPAPYRPFNSAIFPVPSGIDGGISGTVPCRIWAVIETTFPGGHCWTRPDHRALTGPKPHHDINACLHERKVYLCRPWRQIPALEHTWYQRTEKPKIWRQEDSSVERCNPFHRREGHGHFRLR